MNSPKIGAAFVGALVMGVLSVAPIVAVGNVCCCLWIVAGGGVAAWVLQQRQPTAITPADGLVVGLLAGVLGSLVYLLLSIPLAIMGGPFLEQVLEQWTSSGGDPRVRETFEQYRSSGVRAFAIVAGFLFFLFFGVIFASLGGLLGAMIFRKTVPPPIPPSDDLPPPLP